ncbi:MAG TPA: N-formylglutamate amidohydrolase [Rhodobacteraceae bacterium]|nr:N-formylglutamate amidohydrolase [Alphaproteobacteria bacterium]HAB38369.1 N-formylglutamate amidohydrolase [Paracoccaceae bacterium]
MVKNTNGSSSIVIVCEHASSDIPASFNSLGVSKEVRKSHAAWDPGALAVSIRLSEQLDAALIAGAVSRLVYDCNRPPDAPDAMPSKSEIFDIPGNAHLSQSERDSRVKTFYRPFQLAVRRLMERVNDPILVTVHSFTPVYHGKKRSVEIGILHDKDARFADAMLETANDHTNAIVRRNKPYGPEDGVTHTLKEHGINGGYYNVMLEIRNDLIKTTQQQDSMAKVIAGWIVDTCMALKVSGSIQCQE